MMAGVEPAVVGVAEAVEGADVDHAADLGRLGTASSVSDVTKPAPARWEICRGVRFADPAAQWRGLRNRFSQGDTASRLQSAQTGYVPGRFASAFRLFTLKAGSRRP
jgi:hypothetical protein